VAVLLPEHEGHRDGGDGLSEYDDVTEHRSAAGEDPAGERLHRVDVVGEELLAHDRRDAVLDEALPHVPGEVVTDLQVDLVGLRGFSAAQDSSMI
jgi:hypothetical protein